MSDKSYLVIKIKIGKEVMACDVSPVEMFFLFKLERKF